MIDDNDYTLSNAATNDAGLSNNAYLSVGELSAAVKRTIEGTFDYVRVRGEISQPRTPASGHVYFTLKDEKNALAAVIWRGVASGLQVRPEDGLDVICTGKMTTFGGQSKYQLIVNEIEVAGEGALLKQLEDRRRKLASEGLFDNARKKPIPAMPSVIGVVTSPTGAVIRDILHRVRDRFGVHVLVWGVNVQGVGAAEQITAAIEGFNALPEGGAVPRPDLLIVARGGGSLEDLWCFNEENVVRAAAGSQIPLISAVGHETDTTLIDYASDMRAPTPSAAAEMATPVAAELAARLSEIDARLRRAITRQLDNAEQMVRAIMRGLLHPAEQIARQTQSLDIALAGLDAGMMRLVEVNDRKLAKLSDRIISPEQRLAVVTQRLGVMQERLDSLMMRRQERAQETLSQASRLLSANSYERVLERGFALVTDETGQAIKRSDEAAIGAKVEIKFADKKRAAQLDPDTASSVNPKAGPVKSTVKPVVKPAAKPTSQEELF